MSIKKVVLPLLAASVLLTGCTSEPVLKVCEHKYVPVLTKEASCTEKGEMTYTCSLCNEQYAEEVPVKRHSVTDFKVTDKPTVNDWGYQVGICSVCGEEVTESIPRLGSTKDYPRPLMSSADLYKSVKKKGCEQYVGDWMTVKGKIKQVSTFSDMNGYYLEGKTGQGVVCWINERSQSLSKGQTVTFVGKVSVDAGNDHIELSYCEVVD